MNGKIIIGLIILLLGGISEIKAETKEKILRIKITDSKKEPVFGVYVVYKAKSILLTTSDIDGECTINYSRFQPTDSLQFQGMGYETETHSIRDLILSPVVKLKELKYDLQEAVIRGISTAELLKIASSKLQKSKARRIPLCYYYAPARYEKITWCRDSAIEYRREYGYYFYSGDIKPLNIWDETYRSYIVPEYMAQSYSLTVDGSDTIVPIYMTSEDIRFDVGTRKIFTLIRAVQLFAPLFNDTDLYDIQAIDTDSLDYIFSFKTKTSAYPDKVRISCKGTFTIDRERQELKGMDFDYIDYQLLRQILLTDKRKTSSPFSTRAGLTFAYDSTGRNYIRSCTQSTTWKYDLSPDFILIEQPSRIHPGMNKLIEEEAFYCYDQKPIPRELQNTRTLARMHLAFRYPLGKYDAEIFKNLSPLLQDTQARKDVGKYMDLEKQFQKHNERAFYPENYILNSLADDKSINMYQNNLSDTRETIFKLFGPCPRPGQLK
ncbi:MAG: hypothetical protein EGP82_10675 [Odoribacter splanchnicus]|nr:hypothetical protein [Odoribacter splanchnicus]